MTARTLTPAANNATIDRWVVRIAGALVLVSVALSQLLSVHWLWLTAFVGANLLQASFTGFCPLASMLGKLGVPSGAAFRTPDRI